MAKEKSISIDSLFKQFLQKYNIPTKSDVEKLLRRIDHLEDLIKTYSIPSPVESLNIVVPQSKKQSSEKKSQSPKQSPEKKSLSNKAKKLDSKGKKPTDIVLDVLKRADAPLSFPELFEQCPLEEKQLRNTLYRLDKKEKIFSPSRGKYELL